jgi:dimethylargininase
MTVNPGNHRSGSRGIAFLRPVPNSYAMATTQSPSRGAIDVELAKKQHLVYQSYIRRLGFEIQMIPLENISPDSLFVEDVGTVVAGRFVLNRSGHPGRRCERQGFYDLLSDGTTQRFELVEMLSPASADGGDVLRVGSTIFIGLSDRTNREGVECFRRVFEPLGFRVVPVALPEGVLHLKCVCSEASPGVVVRT